MASPIIEDLSITKLLDRMLRSDLPVYPLVFVSFLISFAWSLNHSGEILSATAVAMLTAWLVVIPVAFFYLLLIVSALTLLKEFRGHDSISEFRGHNTVSHNSPFPVRNKPQPERQAGAFLNVVRKCDPAFPKDK